MKEKESNLYVWVEPNVNWSPHMIEKANQFGRQIHKIFKLVAASSDEPADFKQMGGSCMGMADNIVGRHMKSSEDDRGLGRWTYVCLAGKDQRKAYFITGYRP
eukprot:11596323-Ditylum_brightwellii.AAC.1